MGIFKFIIISCNIPFAYATILFYKGSAENRCKVSININTQWEMVRTNNIVMLYPCILCVALLLDRFVLHVCELFGETSRNMFGCACYFVVACYGSV